MEAELTPTLHSIASAYTAQFDAISRVLSDIYSIKIVDYLAQTPSVVSSVALMVSIYTAYMTKKTLASIQRPFVDVDRIEHIEIDDGLRFIPKVMNYGNTPALRLTNYLNWKPFEPEVPKTFEGHDQDSSGNPIKDAHRRSVSFSLAPKASASLQDFDLPLRTIADIAGKKVEVVFWGSIQYKDFLGRNHITKFGCKLNVQELAPQEGKRRFIFNYPKLGGFNDVS